MNKSKQRGFGGTFFLVYGLVVFGLGLAGVDGYVKSRDTTGGQDASVAVEERVDIAAQ